MMKLLIATRNAHKLAEIRAILALPEVTLIGVNECEGHFEEVVEDADTFAGNALKKARSLCTASGLWTLADDSGLEVEALNGAPGVFSARYAGEGASDAENNRKLLRELADVADRRARFRCVLALAAPDGRHWFAEGRCEGTIALEPHGRTGFGYDPLFHPLGESRSFAEMSPEAKNRISHRGRAIAVAVRDWKAILAAEAAR